MVPTHERLGAPEFTLEIHAFPRTAALRAVEGCGAVFSGCFGLAHGDDHTQVKVLVDRALQDPLKTLYGRGASKSYGHYGPERCKRRPDLDPPPNPVGLQGSKSRAAFGV